MTKFNLNMIPKNRVITLQVNYNFLTWQSVHESHFDYISPCAQRKHFPIHHQGIHEIPVALVRLGELGLRGSHVTWDRIANELAKPDYPLALADRAIAETYMRGQRLNNIVVTGCHQHRDYCSLIMVGPKQTTPVAIIQGRQRYLPHQDPAYRVDNGRLTFVPTRLRLPWYYLFRVVA